MPRRLPTPCRQPGCPALVEGGGYCDKHKKNDSQRRDQHRGSSTQRGYGYRWQKSSKGWLRVHPLCAECERQGRVAAATVVDHIVPHRGDMQLFWDPNNWESLCKPHHDAKTGRGE